jgi:hypothetical protein
MCCVCVFSLHRESPDIILRGKPLISRGVMSHRHAHASPSGDSGRQCCRPFWSYLDTCSAMSNSAHTHGCPASAPLPPRARAPPQPHHRSALTRTIETMMPSRLAAPASLIFEARWRHVHARRVEKEASLCCWLAEEAFLRRRATSWELRGGG